MTSQAGSGEGGRRQRCRAGAGACRPVSALALAVLSLVAAACLDPPPTPVSQIADPTPTPCTGPATDVDAIGELNLHVSDCRVASYGKQRPGRARQGLLFRGSGKRQEHAGADHGRQQLPSRQNRKRLMVSPPRSPPPPGSGSRPGARRRCTSGWRRPLPACAVASSGGCAAPAGSPAFPDSTPA